jgi:hypothetical protein
MVVVSRRARTHRGMVVGEHRDDEEREKQEEDPLTERLHGRQIGEEREKQEEDPLTECLHGRQIGEERRGRFMRLESADDRSHDRPRHVRLQHDNPRWRRRRGREGYRIRRHALLRRGEERREAGSRERRLGRCDRISRERGEGGSTGRAEHETDLR